jgi:hypothetical protein
MLMNQFTSIAEELEFVTTVSSRRARHETMKREAAAASVRVALAA